MFWLLDPYVGVTCVCFCTYFKVCGFIIVFAFDVLFRLVWIFGLRRTCRLRFVNDCCFCWLCLLSTCECEVVCGLLVFGFGLMVGFVALEFRYFE